MTPAARPRFRTDLVAEPIQEDGKRFIDVFDPDSGTGFRFYEVEYSLACAMDGERDVAGLVRWAKEELGVEPSPRELSTVISTLGELGYLAGERPADVVGDLVQGVIAAPPVMAPPVEDVELGTAGAVAVAVRDLPSDEVELGHAGGVSAPRIVVDEFGTGPELGPAGRDDFPMPPVAAVPVAVLRPTSIPDSDTDGPTDLPRPVPLAANDEEISTDLSDHLAISASDVKDAVRASRVMQAVDMPADIAATLAAAEAEQESRAAGKAAADKATAEATERAAADQAAAEAAERAAAEKAVAEQAAAERAAQAVVRPAIEQPSSATDKAAKPGDKAADKAAKPGDKAADKAAKPGDKAADKAAKPGDKAADKAAKPGDKAAKPAVEPPAEPRTSRALIALLILTILLAGTYLVWTQLLKKPLPWEKAKDTTAAAPTRPVPPPPPPAPPPPPPPSSTLASVPGATTDVAAGRQGTIVEVIADGKTVAAGDELARFAASPALTKQLAANKKRLEVDLPKIIADLTAKRDAAVTANKPEPLKVWQERLDKQLQARSWLEAEVLSLSQQLDAYVVKAPLAGTVKTQVAKAAKVANIEQVIASITAPTTLVAHFTINPGKSYSVAQSVRVQGKSTAGGPPAAPPSNCTVSAVEGTTVTVECPTDTGLVGGTDIILE